MLMRRRAIQRARVVVVVFRQMGAEVKQRRGCMIFQKFFFFCCSTALQAASVGGAREMRHCFKADDFVGGPPKAQHGSVEGKRLFLNVGGVR